MSYTQACVQLMFFIAGLPDDWNCSLAVNYFETAIENGETPKMALVIAKESKNYEGPDILNDSWG